MAWREERVLRTTPGRKSQPASAMGTTSLDRLLVEFRPRAPGDVVRGVLNIIAGRVPSCIDKEPTWCKALPLTSKSDSEMSDENILKSRSFKAFCSTFSNILRESVPVNVPFAFRSLHIWPGPCGCKLEGVIPRRAPCFYMVRSILP